MTILVSVVVPTCRRERRLDHCLAALTAQTLDPERYEILVVDDANDPVTQKQVANWAKHTAERPRIAYVPVRDRHGVAAARNAGWREARGAIVAFTADEALPRQDWLAAGLAAMCGDVVAAAGGVHVPLPNLPAAEDELAAVRAGVDECVNCFVRRDALAGIGGFDPRFTAAWREDFDLFFTLLEARGSVVGAPDAIVVPPARGAPRRGSLRGQRKIMFDALLYKKHPRLYRQKISAAPPWRFYAIVLALLLFAAASIAESLPAAAAAAALWLVLTAEFLARRLHARSRAPATLRELIVTALLIPPLTVFWRLVGAVRFRAPFA